MEAKGIPFISMWEKDVLLLKNHGNSFEAIAARYGISAAEIKRTFDEATDKLHILCDVTSSSQVFPCDTVEDFLIQLGVTKNMIGSRELEESIRITYLWPELTEDIIKGLLPAVAMAVDKSTELVRGRIYNAVHKAYVQSRISETPASYFFEKAGLSTRTVVLRDFLLASHDYITELFYVIPEQQKKHYRFKGLSQ